MACVAWVVVATTIRAQTTANVVMSTPEGRHRRVRRAFRKPWANAAFPPGRTGRKPRAAFGNMASNKLALDSGVRSRVDTVSVSSCCVGNGLESSTGRCPQSGSAGVAVDLQTVKALLTEQALARLEPTTGYRFCADARCNVVYFSGSGSHFSTVDLRVPVRQKQPSGRGLVCYCFGESDASIRAEIETTGRSLAVQRVREHITAGRCACEVRNPRGTCCLGDVMAAVKRVESRLAARSSADAVTGVSDAS